MPARPDAAIRRLLARTLAVIMLLMGVLVAGAAVAMRLVEPRTFHDLGDALWWSVVTVSTIGYGDIVPVTGHGKLVATVLILFGMAWMPTVTSIVSAILIRRLQELNPYERTRIDAVLDRLDGGEPPAGR